MRALNQITINGKSVNSFLELISIGTDNQGSGTIQGTINIDGNDYLMRKHWSYSGGFPIFNIKNQNELVGELIIDNNESYYENGNIYDKYGNVKSSDDILLEFKVK